MTFTIEFTIYMSDKSTNTTPSRKILAAKPSHLMTDLRQAKKLLLARKIN